MEHVVMCTCVHVYMCTRVNEAAVLCYSYIYGMILIHRFKIKQMINVYSLTVRHPSASTNNQKFWVRFYLHKKQEATKKNILQLKHVGRLDFLISTHIYLQFIVKN
jgi:hypothetical protein